MGRPPRTRFSAEKLKALRSARGLSQLELAGLVGWEQSMVGRYEAEHTVPRLATVERLAGALGVHVSALQEDR